MPYCPTPPLGRDCIICNVVRACSNNGVAAKHVAAVAAARAERTRIKRRLEGVS